MVFPQIAPKYNWYADDGYDEIAENVRLGKGYTPEPERPQTMKRLPVYPMFLFLIFSVVGKNFLITQIIQSIISGLGCLIIYQVAKNIFSEKVGLLSAVALMVYPNSILYAARYHTETVYMFLLLVMIYFLLKTFQDLSSYFYPVLAGITNGLLLLTKSTTVFLLPFLLLALLSLKYWRSSYFLILRNLILVFLFALLVMTPWIWRNFQLTGRFIPLATWGGVPFYNGYYVATHLGNFRNLEQQDAAANKEILGIIKARLGETQKSVDEYQQDSLAYTLTLNKMREQFPATVWIIFRGFFLTWFLTYNLSTTIVSMCVHLPILLFFVLSVKYLMKNKPDKFIRGFPLLAVIIYFNLLQGVMYPHVRYISPIVPLVLIFVCAELIRLAEKYWEFRS